MKHFRGSRRRRYASGLEATLLTTTDFSEGYSISILYSLFFFLMPLLFTLSGITCLLYFSSAFESQSPIINNNYDDTWNIIKDQALYLSKHRIIWILKSLYRNISSSCLASTVLFSANAGFILNGEPLFHLATSLPFIFVHGIFAICQLSTILLFVTDGRDPILSSMRSKGVISWQKYALPKIQNSQSKERAYHSSSKQILRFAEVDYQEHWLF